MQDTVFNNCCKNTVTTMSLLKNCLNVDRSNDILKQVVLPLPVNTHKMGRWISPHLRLAQPWGLTDMLLSPYLFITWRWKQNPAFKTLQFYNSDNEQVQKNNHIYYNAAVLETFKLRLFVQYVWTITYWNTFQNINHNHNRQYEICSHPQTVHNAKVVFPQSFSSKLNMSK
jgi:hypothetical protein